MLNAKGLTVVFALCLAGAAQAGELRIMPLGDSITYGSHSAATAGYRGPLYTLLTEAGYENILFVGTATDTPGTLPAGQQHHEGHSGWVIMDTSASSRKGVYEYLPTSFGQILGPHVILLHIGTNDASVPSNFPDAINRLDALLDRLSAMQPSAEIIVTSLLERTDNATYENGIVTYFNPYLPGLVAQHAAKGQKVHFYDMRPKVDAATELDDKLHPNAVGYAHMAEGWFEAISQIVQPAADYPDVQPALALATVDAPDTRATASLRFNTPLAAASAENPANYALAPAGRVAAASLSQDARTVTLELADLAEGVDYTLTASGLANASASATLAATKVPFRVSLPGGPAGKVDEFRLYELVYDLDIPAKGAIYDQECVAYRVDNHEKVGAFSRVAYYLELQKSGGGLEYVWASMDAFTDDAGKIGLPTRASGAQFQQTVSNLKVYSNVAGVATGERGQGNIEFWPFNYTAALKLGLEGASGSAFDFDDTMSGDGNFGSFQVHDTAARATVFAYNLWGGRNGADGAQDLGIGTCPTSGKGDWTRAENSDTYSLRHFQVYVMPDVSDATPPSLVSAARTANGQGVVATFSKPVAAGDLTAHFSISGGAAVEQARRRADDPRVVELTLADPFALGASPVLSVSGLRDASPQANAMPLESVPIAACELPSGIAADVDESLTQGYALVATLDIAATNEGWTVHNAGREIYRVDRTPVQHAFDRVAYYLELVKVDGSRQFVWTSMDAFDDDAGAVGVPLKCVGVSRQTRVANLDVASNVPGVASGRGMNGAVEFTWGDYSAGNDSGWEGASASTYDFDDTLKTTGDYGCMQVHNLDERKVVWAFNRWGREGSSMELGIGSSSGEHPDYTSSANGSAYVKRTLHVLVRPTADYANMPARVSANVPEAKDYQLAYELDLPVKGYFANAASNALITVRNMSAAIAGFDRQAYYLELVPAGDASVTNWVWTSFDAVTDDPTKLTIPSSSSAEWTFWQKVSNLSVFSNVSGIQTGTGIETGNIEFHNKNFGSANALGIPNASASRYDFGDTASTSGDHACMQVHNHGANQTIWAINKFYRTGSSDYLCLGIGSRTTGEPDWTNANNARDYSVRRLFVFARPAPRAPALPVPRRAVAARSRARVCVSYAAALPFDVSSIAESVAFSDADLAVVHAARSAAETRDLILTLDRQLALGQAYTVTVPGPGAAQTLAFTAPAATLPAVLDADEIDELPDYRLVNALALPAQACYSHYGADYQIDESRFNPNSLFDRVAYCLELAGDAGREWVWTSFDAPVKDTTKIGLPTIERGILVWGYVSDMNVIAGASSGTPSCRTGRFARGNVEFCASNYGAKRLLGLENATDNLFDIDDTYSDGGLVAGCGSMQVHNPEVGETVFSVSSYGNLSVDVPRDVSVGIGTSPSQNNATDWTYAKNAKNFTVKNLYVLVRPYTPPSAANVFLVEPVGARVSYRSTTPVTLKAFVAGEVAYQWRCNGEPIPYATAPFLDLERNAAQRSGLYDVVATFPDGTQACSAAARVTFLPPETQILIR